MRAPRRRPPALKHGLFSRQARDEWSPQIQRLADALLGTSPRDPQLLEAAARAAEAILWLRQIQQWRLHALEGAALARANRTDDDRKQALRLASLVKAGAAEDCRAPREDLRVAHDRDWIPPLESTAGFLVHLEMERHAATLRRLADYERRAASLLRKALRRLDYERIEVERRARRAA